MDSEKFGIIYLIPTPLEGQKIEQALSAETIRISSTLDYFIAENAKSARAFLKALGTKTVLQQIKIEELNEHSPQEKLITLLEPVFKGQSCGLISEAGAPCLADPGTNLIALAHQYSIKVMPLIGPSSVMLAIMCSGLNGQNFSFCGYLPNKSPAREIKIKELETSSIKNRKSHFFIETPYRTQALFKILLATCSKKTKISLGVELGNANAWCCMKTVNQWQADVPELTDKLVVFGLEA